MAEESLFDFEENDIYTRKLGYEQLIDWHSHTVCINSLFVLGIVNDSLSG